MINRLIRSQSPKNSVEIGHIEYKREENKPDKF